MTWDNGEVAVLGLGKSGRAAATLLARAKVRVYASDAANTPAVEEVAELLRNAGVATQTGGHDLARIRGASALVVSPGIPPSAPPIAAARDAHVPIVGEVEVALRAMPGLRYIAVTGTNGKTTTTALIGHLLRALGHDAVDAGNIGTPLADVALGAKRPDWVALEMSSFQLHDTPGIDPVVGVVTNLSPDHLDRYESVGSYYADKARIFANARASSKWVLNEDDGAVLLLGGDDLAGERFGFSLKIDEADAFYDREVGQLMLFDEPLLPRDELELFGDHNVANALAASLAVMVADVTHRAPDARKRIA
ncbi:MAG: UDP-N-acetylmuramoyl-L-alanine--D-glutamate ligase [Gemmatimonadota bacterium]|nr:UDP-N-acetylmuramoyl-L-alanine--D-glutamate ligase [Gemmatimonadota bacterium]